MSLFISNSFFKPVEFDGFRISNGFNPVEIHGIKKPERRGGIPFLEKHGFVLFYSFVPWGNLGDIKGFEPLLLHYRRVLHIYTKCHFSAIMGL